MGKPVELLLASDVRDCEVGTRVETVCIDHEGREIPVEVHLGSIEGPERLLVVTLRDMTELQAGREARFEAEAKYRTLVEQIPAVVYLDPVDENKDSIYVSPQITDLLGIEPKDWLEDPYCWRSHVHPTTSTAYGRSTRTPIGPHVPLNHEYRMVARGRHDQVGDGAGVPDRRRRRRTVADPRRHLRHHARKAAEEQVAFLAYHDKLTGLPNRALVRGDAGERASPARAGSTGGRRPVPGPRQLQARERLVGPPRRRPAADPAGGAAAVCTRETDMVARQGGDEFLLLLADLERGTGAGRRADAGMLVAESVAARVREALDAAVRPGRAASSSSPASIGISLYPARCERRRVAAAERRRRDVPVQGVRARAATWSSRPAARTPHDRLSFSTRLRQAVPSRNWVLHYQPIIDLGDGTVDWVEALCAGSDPNGGLVAPGRVHPARRGDGPDPGDRRLGARRAGAPAADMARAGRGPAAIGFNLSPRQMWTAHLAEKLLAKLAMHDVDPRDVTVEITESTAMADPDRTQRLLTELHAWGFTLAHRRLRHRLLVARPPEAHARRHPEDRPGVRPARGDDRDLAGMVRAMIQLARAWAWCRWPRASRRRGSMEFLRANGCRLAQGFHFARPVPPRRSPAGHPPKGGLVEQAAKA